MDAPVAHRDGLEAMRQFRSRIALNTEPLASLPASADADLIAQFDSRVKRMFALLDAAIADPVAIADLRDALHRVAGTAAFFGKAALGTMASDVDAPLGDPARATAAFLAQARGALQRAAGGEG